MGQEGLSKEVTLEHEQVQGVSHLEEENSQQRQQQVQWPWGLLHMTEQPGLSERVSGRN